ncbi:uncharacterized protein J3D65DRAFT_58958 [Phyllosticta citribraziliensis]|uniref:Uncharacterized protein n=1 Tax=Phyllosticta citribraziliensis TaxID=989973 RepID=A0ABR1LCB6_9PEZI
MPSAKKKGKKGKKGKRISLPGSPAPEPVASEREPEVVEHAQESAFDRQSEGPASQFAAKDVADDVQTQLQTEDASAAPADAGGEAGEEEWTVPVRKKSKKGKKWKAVEPASDSVTAGSGTIIEPESRMEPASLVEPAVESESVKAVDDDPSDSQTVQIKEEIPTDSPLTRETRQDDQISAIQPEEAGEDEWAVSSGKKKGEKGKKGKRASLPVSPPAEPELESTVKPVSDSFETFPGPVVPEQETITRDQASKTLGEQAASDQEAMPTEAGEDEWALPGKKKKGKSGRRTSTQGLGALESEVPGKTSLVDPNQDSQHLDASMEASGEANKPSAPVGVELGGDQLRAEHAGESDSLPTMTVPPTQESHGSEITSQSLDEPIIREELETATSPQEADEWSIPKKKKKGKKSRLSLPSTPPVLEDTERQIESSEEQFIDPSDVLKYASAASVENEPPMVDSKSMDNQPQEFHQDPVLPEVEPERGASGDVEEFIDPSDVLKYAAASQAGQDRSLDEEERAAEFDDPRPVSTAENDAPHQRSASPVAEQITDQPSIAEPSFQADDSDLNPVLAPAKVSKKDKKKTKKKNKLQASLADYAPLDSSQNATDTEPLLAREPFAEPSSARPVQTEDARPQSPQAPAATATPEDEWAVPAKKSKKDKRKSKKSRGAASPPMPPHEGDLMAGVEYFSPTEETERAALDEPTTFGLTRDVAASVPERSSRGEALGMFDEGLVSGAGSPAPRENLEESSRRGQDVEPLPSSEHEGSRKREVDPSPEGPVRRLPTPHETSGVSFVQDEPINEPQASKSRPKTPEERAKSPNRDIDFAATVAAGLEGAGLDANLVLNDPAFSERKSPPRSTGEADPEEVFIPARPRKNESTDATSPPAEKIKNTSTSGEKLSGQDAAFDAALSSVLADPTFNRRTPSPDSAKEAVSDEFFPFQKRSKKKKSKAPASEELPATRERIEDSRASARNSTGIPFATPDDNEPFSDPGTPFEEHMTEYFPHEKPRREGLGLMGMGSSSKSWAEQMEEEEKKVSGMEEDEGMMGMGGKAAAVGAAGFGAAGVAALRHRGDSEGGEETGESVSKADANMASSHLGASKSVEDFKVTPEERPFSPPTPSKLAHLFPGLERVKRRVPSPRDDFEQSVPERRPSPIKQDNNAVRLTQPIQSNWNPLIRDSAVTMNDTPPLGVDAFHDAGRDSGYHDDSRRESAHVPGQLLDPVPEIARHQVEGPALTSNPQDNAAASSPTESITTTKQRSSALFQSPGSTNEAPAESQGLAEASGHGSTAPPFPQHVTEPITVPAETTQPLTPPRMWSPQPLDTIREHSPEESPLAKKSRPLSDVGMPEHGLKSMRRSDTEDMEASPRLPSDDNGPPKKIWSGKPPEKGPGRARGASVGSDVAVLSGRRSPSGQSDLSAASKGDFGSIFARIKTPDMLSPAGSTLSQRSQPPPLPARQHTTASTTRARRGP